ncbi:hypothetical protein D3C75_965670 [compost metagenome]
MGIIIPYIQGNETNRQNFQLLGEISKITESIRGLSALKDELNANIRQQKEIAKEYIKFSESAVEKLQTAKVDAEPEDKEILEKLKKINDQLIFEFKDIDSLINQSNNISAGVFIRNREKEKHILNIIANQKSSITQGLLFILAKDQDASLTSKELRSILEVLESEGKVVSEIFLGDTFYSLKS